MFTRILFIASLCFSLCGCNAQTNATSIPPIHINRFDKALFEVLNQGDTSAVESFIKNNNEIMTIMGMGVLNMQSPQTKGFIEKLTAYYDEPTLKKLYSDALAQYSDVSPIEEDLTKAFAKLVSYFPDKKIPAFYMHISGLNQNILVGDSLISLSIDKYMGEDFPLYRQFLYDYQRRLMTPRLITADYVAGWLMSEFPFEGKENVLLDRMIYEGKIKYMVQMILPDLTIETLMGYTNKDEQWCIDNEKALWSTIIERKQLYTPDQMTTDKYFDEGPSLFISDTAPGNLGTWMGWQIVAQYMKETGTTPQVLMSNKDSQQILTLSKFKP